MKKTFVKNNMHSGFTLVEALVAISILMIAIASPLTLAQRGISAAILSRDQMTASFLAQDGIEAVKNIRDQIAMSQTGGDWLSNLSNCICDDSTISCNLNNLSTAGYCNIDTTTSLDASAIIPKSPIANPLQMTTKDSDGSFLKYDLLPPAVGYSHTPSKFSRYINIKKTPANPNEAVVTTRVVWSSPLGTQNIEIKDFMYNYSENI